MKHIFAAAVFVLLAATTTALADEYVNGYTRSDGTYVQGYYRSSPDNTVTNNYSFEGNVNPYTGKVARSNETLRFDT
jgi:opacity protein-like surface antigen